MGGVGGNNHLKVASKVVRGKQQYVPVCHPEEFGYMWPEETFQEMLETGSSRVCLACVRTLERDAAYLEVERLKALVPETNTGKEPTTPPAPV